MSTAASLVGLREIEQAYRFSSLAQLLRDFETDIGVAQVSEGVRGEVLENSLEHPLA